MSRRSLMSALGEGQQLLPVLRKIPVEPGDVAVLAIGVVVAVLGAAELVAGEQHRRALREQQRRQHVALLPLAQRDDRRVVGRALGAAIPGAVVGTAVACCPRRWPRCACRCSSTQSFSVKPSWAVTKLTLAQARRPRWLKTSPEPSSARRQRRRRAPRRARNRARCRGTCRSTRPSPAESRRPGSRRGRYPRARRSA